MTQLISNVLMQPKPDAVERLTLVEKLEQEVNRLLELKAQEKPHSLGYVFLGHHIAATVNAINIVKQHEAESGWISADERLPENNVFVLVWLKSGYSEVLQRSEYEHPNEPSTFIWEKLCCNGYFTDWDITAWQPIQPPSEVQDD